MVCMGGFPGTTGTTASPSTRLSTYTPSSPRKPVGECSLWISVVYSPVMPRSDDRAATGILGDGPVEAEPLLRLPRPLQRPPARRPGSLSLLPHLPNAHQGGRDGTAVCSRGAGRAVLHLRRQLVRLDSGGRQRMRGEVSGMGTGKGTRRTTGWPWTAPRRRSTPGRTTSIGSPTPAPRPPPTPGPRRLGLPARPKQL